MKKSQSNLTLLPMNNEELKRLFERLDHSKFRSSFHLAKKYKEYCNEKGLDVIEQHATATCCRGCLYKWYHIKPHTQLDDSQQEMIVQVIMSWIKRELQRK